MQSGILSKWFVVIVCACVAVASAEPARVIYVDSAATGAKTGASWAEACNYLQDALAVAATAGKPVEIWVAKGVYKPDQGAGITPGDRTASFKLLNGVTLKGGYAGVAAADPNARDVKLYETILSGDLAGNDVALTGAPQYSGNIEPTWADNSASVVTSTGTDATAALDGFTITAGRMSPSVLSSESAPLGGAGLRNDGGSPTVVQCVFRTNFSFPYGGAVYNRNGGPAFSRCTFDRNGSLSDGSAMYNQNSSPTLTGCTFSANATGNGARGGAVTNLGYSHVVLKDCTFTDNESRAGGAIYSGAASVELDHCRFERNRATSFDGGGAVDHDNGDLTITDCTFDHNSSAYSGGAVHMGLGTLLVSHCTFTGNSVDTEHPSAFHGGGALACEFETLATLTDSRFEGNVAGIGGAVHDNGYHMDVTRCTFVNNVAQSEADSLFGGDGGALYSEWSWTRLTDCTFDRNRATNAGGALACTPPGHLFLSRCDFTGNGAEQGGALAADGLRAPLANCLFTGNRARQGGALYSPFGIPMSLRNCTFADNSADNGPTFACERHHAAIDLSHCILWDGPDALWSEYDLQATAIYSDVRGGHPGKGNIDSDPCFVSPGHWSDPNNGGAPVTAEDPNAVWVAGDYHLRSQAGHWDRQTETWVRDNETSVCIDAGNPAQAFYDEPFPNGGIVNLGAYGGTAEASKSYFGEPICETQLAGDINGDCRVDSTDAALAAQEWRVSGGSVSNQPPVVVISQPRDGAVIEMGSSDTIIPIVADATDSDGTVQEVRFFVEYRSEQEWRWTASDDDKGADGWQWQWNWHDTQHPYRDGQYQIGAYAIDDDGTIAFSPQITVTVHTAK